MHLARKVNKIVLQGILRDTSQRVDALEIMSLPLLGSPFRNVVVLSTNLAFTTMLFGVI